MEENTRKGISRRIRTEVLGCVHPVEGNNILLLQLEYGMNKDMSSCLLVFLCSKEEVDMDEPLSNSTEKEQGKLLVIYGNPEVG